MSSFNNFPASGLCQTTISVSPQSEDSFRCSNTSFVSDSGNYLTESFRVNQNSLICPKIPFVPESQWVEASFCRICSMIFEKLKANFRHHCRICGASVCGLCSNKKINEKRACDLCFLRIESQELIERKEKMLTMKDETIKDLEVTIKVTRDKLNRVFDDVNKQKSDNLASEKENKEKIEAFKKKLNETKENCSRMYETFKKNSENLGKITETKNFKSDEFDRHLKRNKDLTQEKEKKIATKQGKVEELENLLTQVAKTKTTKSYADIFEFLEINDDMLSLYMENHSQASESLDELSSFVHKMRKSLAKASAKKSLMIGHSLIKKSQRKERKTHIGQQGLCCGGNDCKIF